MTTSSLPKDYLTTSSDTITLTTTDGDPITISSIDTSTLANISIASGGIGISSIGAIGANTSYSIGGLSTSVAGSTITFSNINSTTYDTSTFKINLPEEWVNCFPEFSRIESMCEEYPGLKIAFEKFKTTYLLVKNHYDTPEDQRPRS